MVLRVSPQGILVAALRRGSAPVHTVGSTGLYPCARALLQDAEDGEEAHSSGDVYRQDIHYPEGGCYSIQ